MHARGASFPIEPNASFLDRRDIMNVSVIIFGSIQLIKTVIEDRTGGLVLEIKTTDKKNFAKI